MWAFHQAWWDAYGPNAHDQTLVVVDPSSATPHRPIPALPLMAPTAMQPARRLPKVGRRRPANSSHSVPSSTWARRPRSRRVQPRRIRARSIAAISTVHSATALNPTRLRSPKTQWKARCYAFRARQLRAEPTPATGRRRSQPPGRRIKPAPCVARYPEFLALATRRNERRIGRLTRAETR